MEKMIKYFDQIKADEYLKERTKAYIRAIAADSETKVNMPDSRCSVIKRRFLLKRLSFSALSVAFGMIILIGGYSYYKTPVNYVSLDINPSVSLGLNHFNRVVEADGINTDGDDILNGTKIMNTSVDSAIKKLALHAKEMKYIDEDGSTVIAITAISDQDETAVKIRGQISDTLQSMVSDGTLNAVIYTDSADLQLRSEAQKFGLSPGKYKLLLLLESLDAEIEIVQYHSAAITDIIMRANELLLQSSNAGSGRYDWNSDMIRTAAEQVLKHSGDTLNDPGIEQEQNQNPESRQNQNQNQSQEKSPENGSSDVEQDQTVPVNQGQITDEPGDGPDQSSKQEPAANNGPSNSSTSSGEKGDKNNNRKNPN